MMLEDGSPFTIFGVILMVVGAILFLVPVLSRFIPTSIHPLIIYTYQGDGFYFVTSPILIIISLVSVAVYLLVRL
ncbi:MAG: hypothetical protein SVJ22_08720 [Halobacteriota archaeon]|nr:hypothetical protein [Halobacteriota archaeon]